MANGLFITDFDGTLLSSDGKLLQRDLDALQSLTRCGVKTAVATGRSIYSFNHSPGVDLPVDYIIFSSGAGVVEQSAPELLYQSNISADMVRKALRFMTESNFDFMLHHPVPKNHKFLYRRVNRGNTDFEERIERYSEFSEPLDSTSMTGFGEAAQFVAVIPPNRAQDALSVARNGSHGLNIIRATSPLDHKSTWIEFFNPAVSKGRTAAWLASKLNVDVSNTIAIGNDYNDQDLLEWAAYSFVVENAADELKSRFKQVASNNDGGVADAINHWIDRN